MNEHDVQKKMKPRLTATLSIAFGAGLLLGFVGSRLLDQLLNWNGVLFQLLPLLLGVIGMLTVGTRNQRPLFNGLCTGWLAWVGVWLSFVVWESFQPQTITDCFLAGPRCGPTTVPFWGDYAGFFLFFYLIFLGLGLFFVAVGSAITSRVLDFVRWRRNKLRPSL